MRKINVVAAGVVASLAAAALVGCATMQPDNSAAISAAVANPARPAADVARDAARKPAAVLAFSHVKPGDKVLELIPSAGYFTHLFSGVVGPNGKVYAASPNLNPETGKAATIKAADPAFPNVTPILFGRTFGSPEPVDMIFTAQNYHDFHLTRLKLDVPALDRALYGALKPGGLLVIEDHSALAGSDLTVPDALHRIDENIVKKEVEAAGFVFEGESDALRNPADPRTANVFTPAIRGHTDQFLLRFRKPG
jgi:predicted methyltransferase